MEMAVPDSQARLDEILVFIVLRSLLHMSP
jgi:hypothetical protein